MHRADQPIGNKGKSSDGHKIKPEPPQHQRHALQPGPARGFGRRMGIQLVAETAQEMCGDPFCRKAKPKYQNDFPGSIQHASLRDGIPHD